MRVAALYDIHGNLPALEAVLQDVSREKPDRIVIGGDIFPGPMPLETLRRVREIAIPLSYIDGNGDRIVRETMQGKPLELPEQYREGIRWNATQLEPERASLAQPWPATVLLQIDGLGRVMFCHATPRNDTEIFIRTTPEATLRPILDPLGIDVLVCGHTHMQFDRQIGKVRVLNAGSVGMPFGEPGAYWALLGPTIELRRTVYDLDTAARRVRATGYPDAANFADQNILKPPPEADMLERFAKAEIK